MGVALSKAKHLNFVTSSVFQAPEVFVPAVLVPPTFLVFLAFFQPYKEKHQSF